MKSHIWGLKMNHYLNELGDYLFEVGENAHISVLTSLWLDMRAAVLVITCHALSASLWQGALSWQSAGPSAEAPASCAPARGARGEAPLSHAHCLQPRSSGEMQISASALHLLTQKLHF